MVTVTPEHPTVPLAQPVSVVQTREAVVRDADGQPLAIIELDELPTGDELVIGEVEDQYWLMTYYFGRGGRDVMLTLDDRAVQARLDTYWDENHRVWWLALRT